METRWLSSGSLLARRWKQSSRNQKQSSHSRGRSVGNCAALAKSGLCVLWAHIRVKRRNNAKAKGQILTPALAY